MRIVSLLPSATEIVCSLGVQDHLVGVTHECDYPPFVQRLPKVTRSLIPPAASSAEIDTLVRRQLQSGNALYTLDLPMLERLRPDLIITQALCDVCAVAEEEVRAAACRLPGRPKVINLEPQTLTEVLQSIREVGRALGLERRADEVVEALSSRIEAVERRTASLRQYPRVAFLEWLDPPFSCGHWNPELVRLAGGIDQLGKEGRPSRTLRWDEVLAAEPEVVFIACCGFNVERTLGDLSAVHRVPGWEDVPAARSGRVYVADGSQYFNRPGPRLVDSLEMLAHSFHPAVHPLPEGVPCPLRVANQKARNFSAISQATVQ
jgi:iron complex transport system substrate-binding protein